LEPDRSFAPAQAAAIASFLSSVEPATSRRGEPAGPLGEDALNRDLAPRDEYFLNNSQQVHVRPRPNGG